MDACSLNAPVSPMSRRAWLASALATWASRIGQAEEPEPAPGRVDVEREIAEVEGIARKIGLTGFRHTVTPHYLGIGDAPDNYRVEALYVCEALASEFVDHFRHKGFSPVPPKNRLTVVTLASVESYARFQGVAEVTEYGTFENQSNRVVVYDLRPQRLNLPRRPEWENLRTLVHEASHQLAFNTSILNPEATLPAWLVEGLAAYCEMFKPNARPRLGGMSRDRLDYLITRVRRGVPWLGLQTLISDEQLFYYTVKDQPFLGHNTSATYQAYAQSWLLVDYLMSSRAMLPRFRKLIELSNLQTGGGGRLADVPIPLNPFEGNAPANPDPNLERELRVMRQLTDARKCLGDFSQLDLAVRRHMQHYPYRRDLAAAGRGPRGAAPPAKVKGAASVRPIGP